MSPPMPKCTWQGCYSRGRHEQKAKDGSVWANLCPGHHAELGAAVADMKARPLLRAWIRAHGGSKAAAERISRL